MSYYPLRDEVTLLDEIVLSSDRERNRPTNILIALIRHPDLYHYLSYPELMEGLPREDQVKIVTEAEVLRDKICSEVNFELKCQGINDTLTYKDFRLAREFMHRLPRG